MPDRSEQRSRNITRALVVLLALANLNKSIAHLDGTFWSWSGLATATILLLIVPADVWHYTRIIPWRRGTKDMHWPRFYRYKVAADASRGMMLNQYGKPERGENIVTIGIAAVIGEYAYCVKWAHARHLVDAA